jgi:hypothetical protein
MRIPKEPVDRQQFYMDLIDKCMVSQSERMSVYSNAALLLPLWFRHG